MPDSTRKKWIRHEQGGQFIVFDYSLYVTLSVFRFDRFDAIRFGGWAPQKKEQKNNTINARTLHTATNFEQTEKLTRKIMVFLFTDKCLILKLFFFIVCSFIR